MTSPELEAGLSSYPPALLMGGGRNRMRARLPLAAPGESSPPPGDGAQAGAGGAAPAAAESPAPGATQPEPPVAMRELVATEADAAGQALPPLPDDTYPPDAQPLQDGRQLTVAAGTPGTYSPELRPQERPHNVTELRERARPDGLAPWAAGQFVPVGTSGKRAHWDGQDWRSGDSPGYPPATGSLPPLPYSARDTPGVQFPGDGDDSPADRSR
jgi:hypothetical protein